MELEFVNHRNAPLGRLLILKGGKEKAKRNQCMDFALKK